MWAGYAGTYFWVDPKEELVAVYMSQVPTSRAYYRKLVKQLVYAISYLSGEGISADQGRAASRRARRTAS